MALESKTKGAEEVQIELAQMEKVFIKGGIEASMGPTFKRVAAKVSGMDMSGGNIHSR